MVAEVAKFPPKGRASPPDVGQTDKFELFTKKFWAQLDSRIHHIKDEQDYATSTP